MAIRQSIFFVQTLDWSTHDSFDLFGSYQMHTGHREGPVASIPCILTSSNSGKRDRRCYNQLRMIEEVPMAMMQTAFGRGRLLWLWCHLSGCWRGVFLHLNAQNHSKSVLAWGNLIQSNIKFRTTDFGLPSSCTDSEYLNRHTPSRLGIHQTCALRYLTEERWVLKLRDFLNCVFR